MHVKFLKKQIYVSSVNGCEPLEVNSGGTHYDQIEYGSNKGLAKVTTSGIYLSMYKSIIEGSWLILYSGEGDLELNCVSTAAFLTSPAFWLFVRTSLSFLTYSSLLKSNEVIILTWKIIIFFFAKHRVVVNCSLFRILIIRICYILRIYIEAKFALI